MASEPAMASITFPVDVELTDMACSVFLVNDDHLRAIVPPDV
jgi:hypothetical protein